MASQFIIPSPSVNQTALRRFSGSSYDAGVAAGREAGILGEVPPVADISIDALCARFGEIDLARYDFTSRFTTQFESKFGEKIERRVPDKRGSDFFPWTGEKYRAHSLDKIEPIPRRTFDERKSLNIINPHDYIEELIPRRTLDETGIAALLRVKARDAPQPLPLQQQDQVDLKTPAYKAGVVVGYVEGIRFYVAQKGILRASITTPDILFSQYVWEAYVRGLALETPAISRDYRESTNLRFLKNETVAEAHFRAVDEQKAAGYRLGFAVRVAREYGIAALDTQNVPFDNSSYDAFMRGFRGEQTLHSSLCSRTVEEPTPVSPSTYEGTLTQPNVILERMVSVKKINENLKCPSSSTLDMYASVDQQMCEAGQRVREAGRK